MGLSNFTNRGVGGRTTHVEKSSRCASKTFGVVALAVTVLVVPLWAIMTSYSKPSRATSPPLLRKPTVTKIDSKITSVGYFEIGKSRKATGYFAHANPIHHRLLQAPTTPPVTLHPSLQPSSQPTRESSGEPSSSPSTSPSSTPSANPTVHPSSLPSVLPTISSSPSKEPTLNPSLSSSPSASPTDLPTEFPSDHPTSIPSTSPSRIPSNAPSLSPSSQPTETPSVSPSSTPSADPSESPSRIPTRSPSASPSTEPTVTPTSTPSRLPSSTPSSYPTSSPSASPSERPSSTPTSAPSTSPSSAPSSYPTSSPSTSPSGRPSSTPSFAPSASPSSNPSSNPTSSPSASPSGRPSSTPSSYPTSSPSLSPSVSPTDAPSSMPTKTPSNVPSSSPTSSPSASPSGEPTTMPSSMPSSSPSASPSSTPSFSPSYRPSSSPSGQPTSGPSASPSASPSWSPSASPSSQPTSAPSASPSTHPTAHPSSSPSAQPTSGPSSSPSSTPSTTPTDEPSAVPTLSSLPTSKPSVVPTAVVPSTSPSARPSAAPSSFPSNPPTDSPTNIWKESAEVDFSLPFDAILDPESIAIFEETMEEFLREEFSSSSEGTEFDYFNVTVISQQVVVIYDESSAETEPVRRLEETSLIVSVRIDAFASPGVSPTTEFNFQSEVSETMTQDSTSTRFYDELYATDAFKDLDPTKASDDILSPEATSNGKGNTATIASSAAGVVLGSVLVLLIIIRHRRVAENEQYIAQQNVESPISADIVSPPPLDYAIYDDDDAISSLDQDEAGAEAQTGKESKEEACDLNWSLEDALTDTFPLQRSGALGMMPHSQPIDDSDDDYAEEGEDTFMTVDEPARESNVTPSSRVLELFEDDRQIDDKIVAGSATRQHDSKPKSLMKSVLNLSCFSDNTFNEPGDLNVRKSSFASDSRMYEIRAPPGPLGIVVDNSPTGGTVIAEVKASSPLKHMVNVGDKIVMLDDVDTSRKSAEALGQWIRKKPYAEEQVLVIMSKEGNDVDNGDDMGDMSV